MTEYYKALKIKPDWTEGWWHLGMISYDAQRYEPARDALRRVVTLSPNDARSWGIMGLCEFQLKDYDAALEHLQRARSSASASDELSPVFRYHSAILLTRLGLFEQAQTGAERVRRRRHRQPERDSGLRHRDAAAADAADGAAGRAS